MVEDFLIARNPEPGSTLPYLLRIPLPGRPVVLKAKDTWPRTAKVYCHRAEWPDDAEVVERVPVRSCVQRGAAIDLVLDRGRENRSQFVMTNARGRQMIFWQSARTTKQARPGVRTPTARASGLASFEVLVDVHERYAWKFSGEQVTTVKRPLTAGDYAVERDGRVLAAVERKSLADLVATLTSGKLRYVLADLAALPRAAVVVEDRYSAIFALERVRPAVVADGIAEMAVRFPGVPIIFAETRALAQQWTYRFLGACLAELRDAEVGEVRVAELATGPALPRREPTTAEIRAWALGEGLAVSARGGRLPAEVRDAWERAHP
ncbi:Lsr2 family protein [Propioniciclava sp. MC1683]|uniref:ERCC4 domain-containing protein n=1 Tax=Propioniciclava sp. MC1683 TaxID=2760309 RepID=UPI0015FF9DAA|nr:ERCC4 domain-containing protein [Propioniciclava sp. MC1683]MBB1502106.1 Lsr2 family protein [Propioniciclava sp. MC1683]